MKEKRFSPTGLIIAALITASIVFLVRHFHIKNFHIVKPGVLYVSGQPRGMDYPRLLYGYHISTIINIRSSFEHRERNWYPEEITWAKNNGVKYIELPVEKGGFLPSKEIQDKFLAVMANPENLPVLLHGSSGTKRVPILVAVWLIKNEGLSAEDTVKIVEKINNDRKITEAENKLITQLTN